MIKIRDLEYLDAIDKFKHFGKAAEACNVSQPTLSGQVIKLEAQLGFPLFERHKRSVMLTPNGAKLVELARKVLRSAEEFEQTAKALADPMAGELHVGLIPTLGPYLLPHIMTPLNQALPDADLYLHEGQTQQLLRKLDEGQLDCIILPWLDDMQAFNAYELFEEPLVLALPDNHALAEKQWVNLNDLRGHKVLTLEDGHCLRDQAMGYCFSAGADEDERFRATSLETLRHMISVGRGITLMPKLATLQHQSIQGIDYRPFAKPEPVRAIVLLTRPTFSRMECVRTMVKTIRDWARENDLA